MDTIKEQLEAELVRLRARNDSIQLLPMKKRMALAPERRAVINRMNMIADHLRDMRFVARLAGKNGGSL